MPPPPSPPARASLAVLLGTVSLTAFALGWFVRPTASLPGPAASSPATGHPNPIPTAPDAANPDAAAQAFDAAVTEPATDYHRRLRLAQAAAGLDRAGIIAALESERTRAPVTGGDRSLPTEALLARFAELDPAAATLWLVQTYPIDHLEQQWLTVTLDAWMDHDRAAALAWGQGLPAGVLRTRLNGELLERLAAIDPAAAVQRLAHARKDEAYSVASMFSRMAEKDLAAACAAVAQLPPDQTSPAILGIVETWARRDPTAAYAWVSQVPPGNTRDAAIRGVYSAWGEQDPAAAAAWLVAHGGTDVGKTAGSLAQQWAQIDVAAARAWTETLPAHDRRNALDAVLSVWEDTDPPAVLEYAMALPEQQRASTVVNAVSQWARKDFDAALAWSEHAAAGDPHATALSAVCNQWSQDDPRACAEYLARRSGDEAAQQELSQAVSFWANESPEAVWRWAQGQADPKVRGLAGTVALDAMAGNDPAQAAARLAQLPPDAQADAAKKVAEKWSETDPDAAGRWAMSQPSAETQNAAIETLAGTWAQDDGPRAAAWLDALPPGETRDIGIRTMLMRRPDGLDPAVAVRLAQSLQGTEARHEALQSAAEGWIAQDPAAARAWVGQSPEFTPEERAGLIEDASKEAIQVSTRTVNP